MFLTLLLIFFICCLIFVLWSCPKYDSQYVPLYPWKLPIIGNALQFLARNNIELWNVLKKFAYHSLKSGGVSSLYLGPHRIYMITDPDDCLTVASHCYVKPFVYDAVKDWIGTGLITAEVPLWKRHRKMINPIFSQRMLNKFLEVFNRQARRLVDQFEDQLGKGSFDQQPMLLTNAVETVCLIIMGLKEDQLDTVVKEYSEGIQELLGVFIEKNQKLWMHIPFVFEHSSLKKKHDKLIALTSGICNEVIQRRKKEIQDKLEGNLQNHQTENFRTILDHLIYLAIKRKEFTDEEIRQNLETIIVTGYDTTAVTLTFVLKLLGMHPEVQEKAYKEIQTVVGNSSDIYVDKYCLPKLVYLEAVVKETLRIYPTVPLIARQVVKDVKLKKYTLPADSVAALSIFGVHRHHTWGPDVELFRPDRWLEPGVPKNASLFAAFSLGKRNCIGKLYGLMSIKTTLAYTLLKYRVSATAAPPTPKYDISLRSVYGHEIKLEKRN